MALTRRAVIFALIVSFALHAGAALWLTSARSEEEPAMMEGGPGLQMAVAGDPFDALSEGDETSEAETATASETAEVVEAETVETVAPVPASETVEQVPPETLAPDATPALRPESVETVAERTVETAEVSEQMEVAAIDPEAPSVAPVTETVEAMDPEPDNVPRPTRRPNPPPRRIVETPPERTQARRERAEPQRRQETRRAERAESRGGSRGGQQANARAGSRESGRSARSGGGRSGVNASEARSNYSGQILARIRNAQRYPASARRQRAQGTATVSFTITAGGGASGIRLARSSGHALLDRAAVDTIRRASPFPPIPRETGRRSMSVTVPISFRLR